MPAAKAKINLLPSQYVEVVFAALVLMFVGMMIIPLPTWLLDILITTNISISVLMLLVAMYVKTGLEFGSFPTILLITTLFRLALNVSSTRLVLLNADAGEVIRAFGQFVVQGNYVVGAVIFLSLTLIQFLVIAKGSERVAEVGARFTLDAMPGKQMSIDAELRSGAISQEEAKKKRSELSRESQFYGAMDGAMKFVKGDAIMGIIITVINIIGGLAIGVAMKDMEATKALKVYGLLTIGDGLVSQIPALLISTAAGLVVTRVASEHEDASLASDVAKQIFGRPKALGIASVFLFLLGIVPGLPMIPFFVLGTVFGAIAYQLVSRDARPVLQVSRLPEASSVRDPESARAMLPVMVPITMELGPEMHEMLQQMETQGADIQGEIAKLRDTLFLDLGITLPGVRIARKPKLDAWNYQIAVHEIPVGGGTVSPTHVLAEATPQEITKLGIKGTATTHPITRLPATWIDRADAAIARDKGIRTLGPEELITSHLGVSVQRRAHEIIGLQEVQSMLDQLERAYPAVVRNVVPKPVTLPLLTDILRRLVEEGVSIRPLREVLEALATYAPGERDPVTLTELVRGSLRRHITHKHAKDGVLEVYMIDPSIEEAVRDAIQTTATGSYLAMPPDMAKDIVMRIQSACEPAKGFAKLLTQADVRRFIRRLIEVEMPDTVVLSYQELAPDVSVEPVGRVAM